MTRIGSDRGVDEMDLDIIKELENDALASNAEIGERIGTSPTTVSRRIQRLLDRRIIAITTIPDPFAFGYEIQATLMINTNGGKVNEVAEKLIDLPNVQYVIITTGKYDIFAMSIFQSSEDMFSFVTDELGRIPNLVAAETMTGLKITAKSAWSLLASQPRKSGIHPTPYVLDVVQLKLLRELENNPRQSHTQLAKKLGIVRHTVRRKLDGLLDDGVIQIVAIPDPFVLGYRARAGILIKASPGRLQTIADELITDERIQQVIINAGRYDIMTWAVFRDSEEMTAFVRGKLGCIPGIISHETIVGLRVMKGSFKLAAGAI